MLTADEKRALVIKAKGGLGNRMLSAVTGCVLAELNGRTPYIDWRDGMYVAPGENLYPLLFDASWMGDLTAFDDAHEVAPAPWSGHMKEQPVDIIRRDFPKSHRNPLLYRKLSIDLIGPDPEQQIGVFWSYLPKLQRLAGRMAKHHRFAGRSIDDITSDFLDRYFRPIEVVQKEVDRIFGDRPGPVIGVHIRFTDRKAPLPKIVRELERLAAQLPDANIFLATDSAEAQEAVLSRFPDTLSIDKALASDETALHFASGVFSDPLAEARNALIDMMALARCDRLVHSRYSTFSVAAALIGRIPKSKQVDVDRLNPKVAIKQFIQART
ncbi:MAG: nodulation protein NodZ [Erythrobacter sp.]|nr:nodulation protein NodZ [Erythrobacter sp.]